MVLVDLGPTCNNGCVFCAQAGQSVLSARSLHERVHEALQSIGDQDAVVFVGGEPTVHDELVEWMRQASKLGAATVGLQTNARRMAYRAYTEQLVQAGLTTVEASLHGTTAPMHDYHTSVQGSFKQTCHGIRTAASLGLTVVVSCVWTRSNYRHTREMVQLVRVLGASALRCRWPRRLGRARALAPSVVPHPELVQPYASGALAYARRVGIPMIVDDGGRLGLPPVDRQRPEPQPGSLGFIDHIAAGVESDSSERDEIEQPHRQPSEPEERFEVKPGKWERRERHLRTGEALREVLPTLFEQDEPGGSDG